MKKQKMQYFKLEERVLFEAGAVIQAAEAAAADQAAAEHSNDGEAAAADDAADQTNNAELAEINTEPGADAVAFAAADTEGKTLIVINSSVKDAEQIYNDMGKNCEILLLEAGTDALDAINAYLDAHNDNLYSAIHIVSHGNEGFLMLNGEKIDNSSLDPADWKGIGEHLTLDADILIYGCDTAANAEGRALIRNIADLTGADVAASANATGADGDWDLEYRTGLIEEATLAPQDYAHSLETVTLTVTETADTANNKFATLADAVAAATDNANDYLIVFDSAYFDGTNVGYVINITETISISTSATITIDGDLNDDGAGDIILDGGNTVTTDPITGEITYGTIGKRILEFSGNNVNVTLTGLTIQNAYTDGSGGAVYFDANAKLTVVNTIFRQNYAAGSGGAIYHSTGMLTVRDSTFTKNYSAGAMITGEKSGTGGGGAIGNNGERAETYVSNSTFTANHSDGNGGAIYYYTNAVLDIDNCIFTQNSAGKEGGAVYTSWTRTYINNATFTANHADSSGGAASVRFSLVTLANSTIVNNTTNGSGAVFVSHKDSAKVIINSIIVGNQKIKNDGTAEDSDIYYYFPGKGETFLINTLYGTIVKSGQYAEYEEIPDPSKINSAVATVEEIFGTATPTPGADGTLAITDSGAAAIAGTLVGRTGTNYDYTYYYLDTANNQWVSALDSTKTVAFDATDTATYGLTGGKIFTTAQNKDANGDAVSRVKTMLAFNAGAYALEAETPSLQVTIANDVLNPFDGEISLREAVYYAENGLVAANNGTGCKITFADSITTVTLADELKITGLTAGLTIDGAEKVTVKVADSVYDYLKSVNTDLSALTAENMQTQLNTAITDSAISMHRVFNISNSVVSFANIALEGGCTGTDNNGEAGAILYADKTSTVTADLVNFRGGIATTGGIIYSAGKLTVTNSEIAYGVTKSTSAIGALVVTTGETLLQDTTLHHGITRNYGGAIEFSSSNAPVVLDGVEIYATHGGRGAGAIRIQKGDVTIRDSYIHDNNCNNGGNLSNGTVFEGAAAIYITGGANVEILNSTITANTNSNMWEDGGAVMVTQGTLYLVNSTVSGNTNCPAGINTSGSSAKAYIINSVLTGNDVNNATHGFDNVPERDIIAINGGTVNIINSVYGSAVNTASDQRFYDNCGYTNGVVNTVTASVSGVTYEDIFGTAAPVDGSIAITATGAAAYAGTLVGKLDGVFYYLSNGKWVNATDATATTYDFNAADTATYGLTGGKIFTTAQNKDANGDAVSRVKTMLAFNAGAYALEAETPSLQVTIANDVLNPFDGEISLREAITYAKNGSVDKNWASTDGGTVDGYEITFADGLTKIDVTKIDPASVGKSGFHFDTGKIQINGGGDIILDISKSNGTAEEVSRLFEVKSTATLSVKNITLYGSGSDANGNLDLSFSRDLTGDNQADSKDVEAYGAGGGIVHVEYGYFYADKVNFERVSISAAPVDGGGVLMLASRGVFAGITVTNSVIQNNLNSGNGAVVAVSRYLGTIKMDGVEIYNNTETGSIMDNNVTFGYMFGGGDASDIVLSNMTIGAEGKGNTVSGAMLTGRYGAKNVLENSVITGNTFGVLSTCHNYASTAPTSTLSNLTVVDNTFTTAIASNRKLTLTLQNSTFLNNRVGGTDAFYAWADNATRYSTYNIINNTFVNTTYTGSGDTFTMFRVHVTNGGVGTPSITLLNNIILGTTAADSATTVYDIRQMSEGETAAQLYAFNNVYQNAVSLSDGVTLDAGNVTSTVEAEFGTAPTLNAGGTLTLLNSGKAASSGTLIGKLDGVYYYLSNGKWINTTDATATTYDFDAADTAAYGLTGGEVFTTAQNKDANGNAVSRVLTTLAFNAGSHALDTLETPSLTVDSADDVLNPFDGVITLREAVTYAVNGLVDANNGTGCMITFADSITTITMSSEIAITSASAITLTIDGAGKVTLDGGNTVTTDPTTGEITYGTDGTRFLTVSGKNVNVTLAGMKLQNGYTAGNGGAIYTDNNSVLTVRDIVFINNYAAGSGGAIGHSGNTLYVQDSTFTQNKAGGAKTTGDAGNPGGGGAIGNNGTKADTYVSNSTFTDNLSGGNGGALYYWTAKTVQVDNSTFTGNTASSSGGAIHVAYCTPLFSVNNSTFSGNHATDGGAITSKFSATVIANSTIVNNTVTGNNGALWLTHDHPKIVLNSIVVGNTNSKNGSVSDIYFFYPVDQQYIINTVYGSLAGYGDATHVYKPEYFNSVNATAEEVFGTATPTPGADGMFAISASGPAAIAGTLTGKIGTDFYYLDAAAQKWVKAADHTVTLDFKADQADYGLTDGEIFTTAQNKNAKGDAVSRVKTMLAFNAGAYALEAETPSLTVDSADDVLNPFDGVITLREAVMYAVNGLVDANDGTGCKITFADSITTITLSSEIAITSAITLTIDGAGKVTIDGGNTVTTNTTTGEITYGTDGVRILNLTGGTNQTITLSGLTLQNAYSAEKGGAIYNAAQLQLLDTRLLNNYSAGMGGAIYNFSFRKVYAENTVFSGNSSVGGGGVFWNDGSIELVNSTVTGNSSAGIGSIVYNATYGNFTLVNSTVTGNSSGYSNQAGSLFFSIGTLTLLNSIVVGNNTTLFWLNNGTVNLYNNVLESVPATVTNITINQANNTTAAAKEVFGTATPVIGADGTVAISASGPAAYAGTLVGKLDGVYYYLSNGKWVNATDATAATYTFNAADTATYGLTGGKVFTTAQNKDSNGDAMSRVLTTLAYNAGSYALDTLETPSLQVTATNDALNPFDGNTSLREAVYYAVNGLVAANNGTGYMITFAGNITTVTLADELKITGLTAGLTIDGAGKVTVKVADSVYDYLKSVNTDLSALTAEDMMTQLNTAIKKSAIPISMHRVFNISNSVVSFANIVLEGGCTGTDNHGSGGGLLITDAKTTLTANNVRFLGGIGTGGAIIYSLGTTSITDSEIAYGLSKYTSVAGSLLQSQGELLLKDTVLHHSYDGNIGGAIYINSSKYQTTMDGVEIYATYSFRTGAGAISLAAGNMTIRDAYIHDNYCGNVGNINTGAPLTGASALLVNHKDSTVEIFNSTITANTNSNMWENGGAIVVTQGTLYLVNSTVSGNTDCPAGVNAYGSTSTAYIINSVLTGNDVNNATHGFDNVPERDIIAINGGTVNIINSVYGSAVNKPSDQRLYDNSKYTDGVVNTDTASVSGVTYEDIFGTAVPVDGSIAITATGAAAYAGTLVGKLGGVFYYLSNGKWVNATDATATTYDFDAADTVTYGLTGGEVFTTAQNKDSNGDAVSRVLTTLAYNAGSYALDAESAGTVVTTTKDAFNPFDGVTSLREAVFHAAADGSVTVADALATGGTPALELDDTLTIDKNLVFDSAFGVGTAGIEIAENVTLTLNHSFSTGSISNPGALIVKDGFSVTTAPATYGNVSYTGADQNILAGTYDDLTLSGSGTKTMLADVTVSGVFSAADITLAAADTTGASNHLNLADTASSITGANANISGTKFVNVNVNQDGTANGGLLYLDSASNSVENSSGIRLIGNTVTIEAPIVYGTVMGDIVITVKDGAGNVVRNDTASNLGWEWQDGNQSVQNAGTASYTITSGDDLYAFSGDLAVTISKAQIMVMGNATSVTYDGNAHTLSGATLLNGVNNVLAGHVVSAVEFDASYTDANMNPGYSISIVADSVKIADANGADMTGNYEITQYIAGTLFINQAVLTVKGNYTETTYNGTAQTLSGATVSGNTLLAGHKLGDVTFSGSATNAGDHWINVTSAVILDSSNNDVTANYNIAYVEGLLKIAAAELTITAGSITETYNGSAFSVDTSTATGLVSGHTVQSVTYGGSGTDAGEYAATVSGAVIVDAAGADVTANYDITYTDGKITINKLAVTVTGEELGVIYNGAEQTISNATITGAVAGHTLNSADFGNGGTDVGEYAVTVSDAVIFDATGADVTANYDITYVDGKITINKLAVTVTGEELGVIYNGAEQTISNATITGAVAGHTLNSATFGNGGTDVGEYAVTVSDAVIFDATGADVTANYDITYTDGKLTIAKRAVTVTADDRTVPYDGKGYTLESATAENLPAGQSIDTAVFGEGGKMVGTYTVSVSNAVIRDAAGRDVTANFDITYVPGILTIEQTAEGQNSDQNSANGLSINQTSAAYTLTSEQHLKPYNAQLPISSTSYQNPADLSLMLSAELRNTHSAAAGLADQHPADVDDSMRNRRPVSDLLRFSGDVTTISPDGTMTSLGIRDGENAVSDSLGHRDGGDLLHNHVDEEHLRKFGDESEILDIQLSRASACMDEFDEALAEMMEVEFA